MTTIIFILMLLVLLFVPMTLWALFLGLGLRWARVEDVTVRRVLRTTILVFAAQLLVNIATLFLILQVPTLEWPIGLVGLALQIAIPFVVIMRVFQTSFVRALQSWLPTLLAPAIMLAAVILVIRPYIFEAYKTPTNSMAPTLLGRHWTGVCMECGGPAYCSPLPDGYPAHDSIRMICGPNFHVTQPSEHEEQVGASDRFVVAKFLKPKRWDIIVFQNPDDPSVKYVMRLVGLPGEEIIIENGKVHADAKLLPLPESIRGIQYESSNDEWPERLWGTHDYPAKLADDQYFVLGDFSPQAKDSRRWENGAEGHPPYAVPHSHLEGVVTHTYWPLDRWRILR